MRGTAGEVVDTHSSSGLCLAKLSISVDVEASLGVKSGASELCFAASHVLTEIRIDTSVLDR